MSVKTGMALAVAMGFSLLGTHSALAFDLEAPPGAPAKAKMTADGPILITPGGMTLYVNSNENMNSERFAWECTDEPPCCTRSRRRRGRAPARCARSSRATPTTTRRAARTR